MPTYVNYRKIYEDNFGPIPTDELGRSYHIHHIDGNHDNNDPSNLMAVSMQEHYNIHYQQGDWAACVRLAQNLNRSQEEISELNRQAQKIRVAEGTHPFLGGKIARETQQRRVVEGTHNFLGGEIGGENSRKRVEEGTHHFLGPEINNKHSRENNLKRIREGTHNFLGQNNPVHNRVATGQHHWLGGDMQRKQALKQVEEGRHPWLGGEIQRQRNLQRVADGSHQFLGGEIQRKSAQKRIQDGGHHAQQIHTCPHCNKTGKGLAMFRFHFEKCKKSKV